MNQSDLSGYLAFSIHPDLVGQYFGQMANPSG